VRPGTEDASESEGGFQGGVDENLEAELDKSNGVVVRV